ncbi:unnamed protein product [Paramecium primaurelia]|uniref:Protein kinase domain-containing protein n=1 Tax=Paramecium primaurelia TaxID=5886 RepID=A0A8S1PGS5_PARPR|nr:unnamed protein product [Paramecium primaurelia]
MQNFITRPSRTNTNEFGHRHEDNFDYNEFKNLASSLITSQHQKEWNHLPRLTQILLNQNLTVMFDGVIIKEQCTLYPNVLKIDSHYIQLSQYQIKRKQLIHNNKKCYLLLLGNDIMLFFSSFDIQKHWYNQIKQFCIMKNLLVKYRLQEQLFQDFYSIIKKKNRQQFSAYIINKQQPYLEHTFGLLHESKNHSILKIKRIYEDTNNYVMITERFEGEPVFNFLLENIQFMEVQVATLIYQILLLLRYLNEHQAYHGNINALNILINRESQSLEIAVIGFIYYPFKQGDDISEYLKWVNLNKYCWSGFEENQIPGIHSDLYQLGVLLYIITFYTKINQDLKRKSDPYKLFLKYMKELVIKYELIDETIEVLTQMKTPDQQFVHVFSSSQLDLIKKLLSNCSLSDALTHQWFVNAKQKAKPHNQRQGLPTLKTIIELKEASDGEASKSQTKRFSIQSDNYDSMDECPTVSYLMRNILDYEKAPCKTHHS